MLQICHQRAIDRIIVLNTTYPSTTGPFYTTPSPERGGYFDCPWTYTGTRTDGSTFTVSHAGFNSGRMFPDGQFVGPICPPEEGPLSAYIFGFDSDGDGETDRCYNPEDKLKIRTKLDFDDTCHESPFISIDDENYPEVYTLSTEDENLVSSSAKEAIDFLAQISPDLNSPSALNKEKLDSISRVFNISDSYQPLFNTLSNVILKVNECVSSRLEDAQLAPNENMYRVKTDKAAQSSIFAQTCYIGSSDEPQIEITERSLKDYKEGEILPFINTLPVTMMHENQHHCGGSHMISSDESDFRLKEKAWLKNRLEMFELQKNYMDELSRQKYFESILKDPSFYKYIIEAYYEN